MIRIFLSFIFLLPLASLAQSEMEILKSVQIKFESIEDFNSDFIQQSFLSLSKKSITLEGNFYYKKNNSFRVELSRKIIISDGISIWNYDIKLNRVVISNLADDPSSFSLEKYVMEYPSKCLVERKDKDSDDYILKFTPEEKGFEFKSVIINAGKDYLIKKIEIVDLSDSKFSIEITNLKINQSIPTSMFTFNPPEGSQIVDLR